MALATTNSGKYGKEGWDELWGENGLWSCRTFSSVRGVSFFVIYRRRNRMNEGRKGRRRLLLFKAKFEEEAFRDGRGRKRRG